MNYFRLYPSKNNTLLNFEGPLNHKNKYRNLNTGKNTIMELHSGILSSQLIFMFEFPDWIKEQIANNSNLKCNLVLYDAGAIYDNVMGERKILLSTFEDDFIEGNGWSFEINNIPHFGISNYNLKKEGESWVDKDLGTPIEIHLGDFHQDIIQDVTSMLSANNNHINFKLEVKHNYPEQQIVKFIHSRHTRTIYKPYLEFYFNDEIIDERYMLKKNKPSKIYIINTNNEEFTESVTCKANDVETDVYKLSPGVHYIELTPVDEFVKLEWFMSGAKIYEEFYEVANENPFNNKKERNITYYIQSNHNQKIFRNTDVVSFQVQSYNINRKPVIDSAYEFKVITNNGFTMQPWTKCNVYDNTIWFDLNLQFYFVEMDYEILLRRKDGKNIETSKENFKFKVISDDETRLKQLSANPYYTREWFFSK